MGRNHAETTGRRLDRMLFTRPLFETLLRENQMSGGDRLAVVFHTVRAVVRYRSGQIGSGLGEVVDTVLFRILARGRIPRVGMTVFLEAGDLVWYQLTDWGVAQRARRAFGRVALREDCTALYCGWRNDLRRGERLPIFVLLDPASRVMEVVYANVEDGEVEGLSPGIGRHLRPSVPQAVPAIQALALWLGVEDFDDRLHWFTGP